MIDFEKLRVRCKEILCGRDSESQMSVKSVLTHDSYTGKIINNIDERLKKTLSNGEPEAINSILHDILEIAVSFSQPQSSFFMDQNIKNLITGAIEQIKNVYNAEITPWGNWWFWEIGIPLSLNSIFTVMREYFNIDDIVFYMNAERHFNDCIKLTGANRLWESVIFAVRGILLSDAESIRYGVSGIEDIMTISEKGDGFHKDGSFIQHGNIPYNCGYGRSLIQELAPVMYVFEDTEFEIKGKPVINEWIYNSYLPFIYNGRAMDMVRGREISRYYEQSDFAYMRIMSSLLILSELKGFENIKSSVKSRLTDSFFDMAPPFPAELAETLLNDKEISEEENIAYFRAFNSMDRAVKHGRRYAASLSMHSERTAAFESINDENQNSYHTSDGMLHIYKKNEPESDLFWQTIDMERLPGTTVSIGRHDKPNINAYGDFTGGCGIGECGVCAMKMMSAEYNLKANKAWFFFDEEIVCLGSEISSKNGERIETIVENRRVTDNSRFTIHGTEANSGYLISGAYLDGTHDIGYYFPDEQKVKIIREMREGSWSNMSSKTDGKIYKDMYITMWIEHGKDPKSETYEYIIIPKCDENEIDNYYSKSGIRIIENSDSIQCVKKNNVTGVVFLKDKTRSAERISCDKRSVIMTEIRDNILELSAADITHKQDRLYIELDYSAAEIINEDESVNVIQMQPYICIEINTKNDDGKEHHVIFGGIKNV